MNTHTTNEDFPIAHEERAGGGRYVLRVDGRESVLTYFLAGGRLTIDYTYVPPELRRRGLAALLVRRAVEDARARGWKIVPACSYAAACIAREPQWQDMLERRKPTHDASRN